ncbi:hypothetical protein ACTXT7_011125 [Hymenolepis weldensis]
MILSTATPVEAANDDDTKLYPTIRNIVKVTNLKHSLESSMPNIVPAQLVASLPYPSNNQSRNPACLINRQIKYAS